jgi:hypothetical protein
MSKRNAAGLALLSIGALGLAVTASIWLAHGDLAWGSDPTTVSIGSGQGPQSSSVTVPLEILNVSAPGVGAATTDILYDSAVVDPTGWEAGPGWDMVQCNLDYTANTVRCTALSVTGRTGDMLVANITFHLVGAPGQCSPLDVQIVTFTDPSGNPVPVTDGDGQICIDSGSVTPTLPPTATFTATPTPSVTPEAAVRVGSDEGPQDSSVTAPLEILDVPAPGVAAATIDIAYNSSVVDPTDWEAGSGWDMVQCNLDYAANTVRCTALSVTGRSGNSLVANITFHLVGSPAQCSSLDVTVPTFTDPGGSPIPVTPEGGELCVGPCGGVRVFVDPPAEGHYIGSGPIQVDVRVENVTNLGTFDIPLNFDDDLLDFSAFTLGPFLGSTGRHVTCLPPDQSPGNVRVTCYSTDSGTPGADGAGLLGTFEFDPQFRLVANEDPAHPPNPGISLDRVAVTLDLAGAQIGDISGNPITIDSEEDGTRTIGALPGDVSNDCDVDGLDIQYIAGRWPSPPGPYDKYADVQPSEGDGDIDGLDIQFVAGRWPRSCPPEPPTIAPTAVLQPVSPSASPETEVRIGSGQGPQNSSVTVPLEFLNVSAPGVGAATIDILYDPAVVDPTDWEAGPGWDMTLCSLDYAADTVRCTALSVSGRSGDSLVANITFHLAGASDQCSPLDVQIVTFTDPSGNPISASDEDGQICVLPEATVRLLPETQDAPLDGPCVNVEAVIENVTNLGTFDITLPFNDPPIQFDDFVSGDFLGTTGRSVTCLPPVVTADPDGVRVTCYSTDTGMPGPDGSGSLGTFTFCPVAEGSSPIGCNVELGDILANPIPASCVGASIVVIPTCPDTDGDGLTDCEEAVLGTDPLKADTDSDGCADGEELGPDKTLGGQRDPLNPYDFYDITDITFVLGSKDKGVSGFDLNLLLLWTSARTGGGPNANGKDYDADTNGNTIADGLELDFAGIAGPATGPDGAISFDLAQMLSEGGDSCAAPP